MEPDRWCQPNRPDTGAQHHANTLVPPARRSTTVPSPSSTASRRQPFPAESPRSSASTGQGRRRACGSCSVSPTRPAGGDDRRRPLRRPAPSDSRRRRRPRPGIPPEPLCPQPHPPDREAGGGSHRHGDDLLDRFGLGGRGRSPGRWLLARHAPAARPGLGARGRPVGARPRRAAQRPRPGRHPRDAPLPAVLRGRRRHRLPVEPPAQRGRGCRRRPRRDPPGHRSPRPARSASSSPTTPTSSRSSTTSSTPPTPRKSGHENPCLP